jgi:hypothetical protein
MLRMNWQGTIPHKRFYETADRVKYSPCISMVISSFIFSRFHLGLLFALW